MFSVCAWCVYACVCMYVECAWCVCMYTSVYICECEGVMCVCIHRNMHLDNVHTIIIVIIIIICT